MAGSHSGEWPGVRARPLRIGAIVRGRPLETIVALSRRAQRRRLLVVCYHGVARQGDPADWLLLPRETFEAQIRYLSRHYRVLPIDLALRKLWEGQLHMPTAAVTFDDGYANNLSVALPILEKYAMPATVYVVTGLIGSGSYLWTTRLVQALRATAASVLATGHPMLDGPLAGTDAQRTAWAHQLKERLKMMPDTQRAELLEAIHRQVGDAPDLSAFRILTQAELRTLAGSHLITLGAHTHTHRILSRLSDEQLELEIAGSVEMIRGLPGSASRTFAYPNGRQVDYDQRAVRMLRRLDIDAALSTVEGLQRKAGNPFEIRRIVVGSTMPMASFLAASSGLKAWLKAPGGRST